MDAAKLTRRVIITLGGGDSYPSIYRTLT